MPRSHSSLSLIRRAILVLALVVPLASARAADNQPAPSAQSDDLSSSHGDIGKTTIERAEPGKEWWRDVVARFPGCKTLTDGCQSCVPEGDAFTCSNPGIACTRGEWRCIVETRPDAQGERPAGQDEPAKGNAPAPKSP